MKTALPLIAMCATAALLKSHAWAQNQSTNTNPASGPQDTSLQQANAQEFARASTLVGNNTQGSKGNKVGDIKDRR